MVNLCGECGQPVRCRWSIFRGIFKLAQLISCRGLFEFDDVIHNALGTAAGVLLVLGMRRLRK